MSCLNWLILKDKSLRDKISICAVGGYGREILAPFSDLDILFLHNNELNQKTKKFYPNLIISIVGFRTASGLCSKKY